MRVLILLVIFAAAAGLIAWAIALRVAAKDPKVINAGVVKSLAHEAAEAAKRGDFAERDRLDHARNEILRSMNPDGFTPFTGSAHDDWAGEYMRDPDSQ